MHLFGRSGVIAELQLMEHLMSKRELIDTGTDKRYVRRNQQGQFKDSVDVGRSLSADKRQHAEHDAKVGQGDKGDHKSK